MKHTAIKFLTCLALIFGLSNAQAQAGADSARAFIASYDQAYSKGDLAALGKIISTDAVLFTNGVQKTRGEAFAELGKFDKKRTFKSTIDRVQLHGELAVVSGKVNWQVGEGAGVERFTTVLQSIAGGGWQVINDHVSSEAEECKK